MNSNPLRHIAIIMDGNNRWAKDRGLPGTAGHKVGVERIRDVMRACRKHGVLHLTVFAFSSENWQRPRKEVDALMGLFLVYLKQEVKSLAKEGVRLRVIGNRERFSDRIQKAIADAEAMTTEGEATLTIAADYGGQWDIAHAAKTIAEKVASGVIAPEQVDEGLMQQHMSLADLPAPDLLIRTGGEVRISNFLLWQSAYTELYFVDTFWPDFGEENLDLAVAEYHSRQRRFGRSSQTNNNEGAANA